MPEGWSAWRDDIWIEVRQGYIIRADRLDSSLGWIGWESDA